MAASVFCSLEAAPRNGDKKNKNLSYSKKGNPSELPVVKSVGNGGITVSDRYYVVDDSTKITVNGTEGSLFDIKPGMQALVAGGVKEFGRDREGNIYIATRIVASDDNELAKKADAFNKKARERASNRSGNRR